MDSRKADDQFYGFSFMEAMEQVVFNGHTGNHSVQVIDKNGLRILKFGTEEQQTCLDLAEPWVLQLTYTQWMAMASLLHPDPTRFLIAGLGGGAIPHFLLHFFPHARIDVVEKEQLVIDVAHDCFDLPRHGRLRIFCQDVLTFLSVHPTSSYDVIFLDIFDPGAMAPALFEPRLYHALLARLDSRGVLAVNLWSGHKKMYQQALQTITAASRGQLLKVQEHQHTNIILLVFPDSIPFAAIKQALKRSKEYQQRYNLDAHRFLKRLRRTNPLPILRSLLG